MKIETIGTHIYFTLESLIDSIVFDWLTDNLNEIVTWDIQNQ